MKREKMWWESTTIWINLLAVIVPVLDLITQMNIIQDKEVYALIIAVLNILNRFRVSPSDPVKPVSKTLV